MLNAIQMPTQTDNKILKMNYMMFSILGGLRKIINMVHVSYF